MARLIEYFKCLARSKTIWLSVCVVLLSAANAYFEVALSPEAYSAIGVIIGALIAHLRTLTTLPIKDK